MSVRGGRGEELVNKRRLGWKEMVGEKVERRNDQSLTICDDGKGVLVKSECEVLWWMWVEVKERKGWWWKERKEFMGRR